MSIIEIIGTTTIGIIIVAEFMAAIGIAVVLYKIRSIAQTPQIPSYVNLSPAIESLLVQFLEQNIIRAADQYEEDPYNYDYYVEESGEEH